MPIVESPPNFGISLDPYCVGGASSSNSKGVADVGTDASSSESGSKRSGHIVIYAAQRDHVPWQTALVLWVY